jgi:tRNA-dihydrouridine synthase
MSAYKSLPRPFFVLAPMDDVTDVVFRQVIAECASPDVFVTEFVNVDGLQSVGRPRLLHKLLKTPEETNLTAQIWGKTPENYRKTAAELVEAGFAGIDINMGCPDKTVIKNGCCAALADNRELAAEIIAATKEGAAGRVPISVKTRLGNKKIDMSWPEFVLQQDIAMLTIHGRIAKQMSRGEADWDLIGEVRELRDKIAPNTLVVGNGDVLSREQGEGLAKKHHLDGIMIGRGVFHDPYVFSKQSPWKTTITPDEKVALYKKQVELFADTYKNRERSPQTLKRYAKIYINDFEHAADLRAKIMAQNTAEDILKVLP